MGEKVPAGQVVNQTKAVEPCTRESGNGGTVYFTGAYNQYLYSYHSPVHAVCGGTTKVAANICAPVKRASDRALSLTPV